MMHQKPRLCMSRAIRFSSGVMRAVVGMAKHPRRAQRDTTRRLFEPILQNETCNKTQQRTKHRRLTEESSQHPWADKRQGRATNETQTSKYVGPPCSQSSRSAGAWRSRCCVVYVFRLPAPSDRFMRHNIEHKGQGEHDNQSAYELCSCTDVANFIPSTVSLIVVKDPWHMHWTNKSARAYAQHSTMRRHTKPYKSD